MKNALVLDDHFGDDGSVTAGMILKDITNTRFDELEKKGLVREATDKEVKAGSKHDFEKDESEKAAPKPDDKQAQKPEDKKAPEPANKGA